MKRSFVGVWVIVAALVLVLGGMGVQSAQADNISTSVNLPGLNFSFGNYDQGDGRMIFSLGLSSLDKIKYSSVSFFRDSYDPLRGSIYFNAGGIEGVSPPTASSWQNSSSRVDYHGFHGSSEISLGAYQEIVSQTPPAVEGGDWTPVYGNWWSTTSLSVTLSDVTLTSSNSGVGESVWTNDGGGGKGFVGNPVVSETDFYGYANFSFIFGSLSSAETFGGLSPISVQAAQVPEPATMCLLGLGGLGALLRHRRLR